MVSQDQGANSIDGRAILPANGQGILGGVTDAGHWVLVGGKPGVPLVDGVVRGPPADEAVISDDGKNIALLANSGDVLLNGVNVANVPFQSAWLEITGTTLYVYSIVV